MSTLSATSILRLSLVLLGSTAINLYGGKTWGQEIKNGSDSALSQIGQSTSPKIKSIQSVPPFSVKTLNQEKTQVEDFSLEKEYSEVGERDRARENLMSENANFSHKNKFIDSFLFSLWESLEGQENDDFNGLDELILEANNSSIAENQNPDAIANAENSEQQDSISPPATNPENEIAEIKSFPSPEAVSFEAEDLLVQERNETENSGGDNNADSRTDNTGVEQEVLTVDLNIPFFNNFGIGVFIGEPTVLQGQFRAKPVLKGTRSSSNISTAVYFLEDFGDSNHNMLLSLGGDIWVFDSESLSFDFSYFYDYDSSRLSFNVANIRTEYPAFKGGDREVNLPNGQEPFYHTLGFGVEYVQAFSPEWTAAFGANYHLVSIRDDLFTSRLEPVDELGNQLTVTDRGQDILLTLNISALYNNVDDSQFPSRGTRIRLGVDQAIPVGEANISFNRLSGNFTQYVPANLFGFAEGPRTLVLSVQGGTTIGDVPPYEGFTVGGGGSIRGYNVGDVGTGRSFILATAEYRFPVFSLKVFDDPLDVIGSLFVDYGSVLGTGNDVIGQPGEVRQKPGDGFGYGLGLLTKTSIGLFRLEFSFSDSGDSAIYFNIGEHF